MEKHIVPCSGGKDSTATLLRLIELNPKINYVPLFTPTGDELPPVWDHILRIEKLIGRKFIIIRHKHTLNELITEFKALPNWRQRWCTRMLKIQVAQAFYLQHPGCIAYVGLRADEETRAGGIYGDIVVQKYPLREWGWGIKEVQKYLHDKNIKIPARTDCARCYAQKLKEWYFLWKNYPQIFNEAEAQEKKTGFTFRSPSRDTWPAALEGLRKEFENGRIPRGLNTPENEDKCRVCSL